MTEPPRKRRLRRAIHVPALVGLIATVLFAAWMLWSRWDMAGHGGLIANRRFGGVSSGFGDAAFLILAGTVPLIVWLAYKAFFSRFRG